MTLRSGLATPESKARYVRTLFATIADRYDLITVVLSYGQDRRWKRRLLGLAGLRPGMRALDLACGTGDLTHAIAARTGSCVGLDVTWRMLELARARAAPAAGASPVRGDMMRLPFRDRSFDVVTAGYGIRNVPVIEPALAEIRRVLRPGGRVLFLDFDRPPNRILRTAYLLYLTGVGSLLGLVLHGDPDTYRYIPESIRRYPGAARLSSMLEAQGFVAAGHLPVLGGLLAIHRASTPELAPHRPPGGGQRGMAVESS